MNVNSPPTASALRIMQYEKVVSLNSLINNLQDIQESIRDTQDDIVDIKNEIKRRLRDE